MPPDLPRRLQWHAGAQGRTYTTRLWCVLEVFIYISMRDEGEQQVPDIVCLGRTDAELDVVGAVGFRLTPFSVAACVQTTSGISSRRSLPTMAVSRLSTEGLLTLWPPSGPIWIATRQSPATMPSALLVVTSQANIPGSPFERCRNGCWWPCRNC